MPIPAVSDIVRTSGSTSAFAGGPGGSPGGANGDVQFNNGGAFAGASAVEIENGVLRHISQSSDPAAPAAGGVGQFARNIAGRNIAFFSYSSPNSLRTSMPFQPSLMTNNVRGYFSTFGSNVLSSMNITAPTAVGTQTIRAFSTTGLGRYARWGLVSAATAAAIASARSSSVMMSLGNGSGQGGFFWVCRFVCSDAATVAGARQFVGISASIAAPTNVEPSTLTNVIGIGHGAADTNLRIFRGGSVAQAPIDLGANFPANTLSADMYELILYASPAWTDLSGAAQPSPAVNYQVTRFTPTAVAQASGTLSAVINGNQLPNTTAGLSPLWAYRTNNATALAVGLDICNMYLETDV